jgi:hypothetical protein
MTGLIKSKSTKWAERVARLGQRRTVLLCWKSLKKTKPQKKSWGECDGIKRHVNE